MRLILFTIISLNIFAFSSNPESIEQTALAKLLKKLTLETWERGHDQIEISQEKFSFARFNSFLETEMIHMEEELYEEDIIQYNACLLKETCSLYKINVASEFYGGFGFDYHFARLDLETGEILVKSYVGYNE